MAIELMDEHEQGEAVRKWIRQYGGALIGGAVLGIGMIVGVHQWREYGVEQRAEAALRFKALGEAYEARELDLAERLGAELRASSANTPYAALAALREADHAVEAGEPQRALDALQWAVDHARDATIKSVARLRLARVLLDQGEAQRALDAAILVGDDNAYAALAAEVRGDALMALGRPGEAAAAYRASLEGPGAAFARTEVVRMKLDDLAEAGAES
ncbi:MAG TPA: tetratricopeptide repeat protein [Xanthomonadaceae bacterium]|nr:tetratricopeptide repeat protein [Xanthomonadaceae bacterium]